MFHVKTFIAGADGPPRSVYFDSPSATPDWFAEPPRSTPISFMFVLLAVITGVVHVGVAPVLAIAGVHPNLVLIGVVVAASALGLETGLTWAFVAGMTANLIGSQPLGSVPLTLLAVCLVTVASARWLGRLPVVYPVVAALIGSAVADLLMLGLLQLLGDAPTGPLPLGRVGVAAAVNAALALGLLIVMRYLPLHRPGGWAARG